MAFDLDQFKRLDVLVRISASLIGVVLGIVATISLFVSFPKFEVSVVILSFYTVLGSILIVLGELQLPIFLRYVPLFKNNVAKGFFYVFVGSLTFAVENFSSVMSIITMVMGVILALVGLVYIFYSFIEAKAIVAGLRTGSDESRVILDNSPFNPEQYNQEPKYASNGSKIGGIDDGYYGVEDRYDAGVVDYIQDRAGKAVAGAARDEQRQQQIGAYVSEAASNQEYQAMIGNQIADSTDNPFIAMAARNENVQHYAGSALASAANDRRVQQFAGETIASAAEDKDMQRRVAGGIYSGVSSGASAAAGWAQENAYSMVNNNDHY